MAGRNDQQIRALFPGIRQCLSRLDAVSFGNRTFGKDDAVPGLFAAADDRSHRAQIECFAFFAKTVHGFPAEKCIVDIDVENDHRGAPSKGIYIKYQFNLDINISAEILMIHSL